MQSSGYLLGWLKKFWSLKPIWIQFIWPQRRKKKVQAITKKMKNATKLSQRNNDYTNWLIFSFHCCQEFFFINIFLTLKSIGIEISEKYRYRWTLISTLLLHLYYLMLILLLRNLLKGREGEDYYWKIHAPERKKKTF